MLPRLTHSQFPRIYPYTNMAKRRRRRRRRWEMERSESEKLPPSIHPSILEKNEKWKKRENICISLSVRFPPPTLPPLALIEIPIQISPLFSRFRDPLSFLWARFPPASSFLHVYGNPRVGRRRNPLHLLRLPTLISGQRNKAGRDSPYSDIDYTKSNPYSIGSAHFVLR